MFISVVAALLVAGALFYAALLGAFTWGFRRVFSASPPSHASSDGEDDEPPFVSVVIAARNEATHIERCLRAVLQSDYPADRFEVIVVDDFSSDATPERVRRFVATHQHAAVALTGEPPDDSSARRAPPGLPPVPDEGPEGPGRGRRSSQADRTPAIRLLQMHHVADESLGHKREALNHGISAARGPLILTTDADCTPAPGWIGAMTAPLRDADVAFVAGPVRYRLGCPEADAPPKPFFTRCFEHVQALEFLALQAVGAGTIGLGRPTICNSANVAYRQAVYQTLYRPETLGAADDEMLIQRIMRETNHRVAFCPAPEAHVETPPAHGLRAFLRQRQRWASMTPRYPDTGFTLALSGLYGFYLLLLAAAALTVWMPALLMPLLAALGLKLAAEAVLLVPTCRRFEQPGLLWALVPFQPLHVLYLVGIGAAGTLGTPRWKGRAVE